MKKIEMSSAELMQAVAKAKERPPSEGYRMEELMVALGTRTPLIARQYVRKLIQAGLMRVASSSYQRVDGIMASVRTYVPITPKKAKHERNRGTKRSGRKRYTGARAGG